MSAHICIILISHCICHSAVNLGYSVVGILGTLLVRKWGRDWLSYIISVVAGIWYFLWWRFVEESLHPNRPKRDVTLIKFYLPQLL